MQHAAITVFRRLRSIILLQVLIVPLALPAPAWAAPSDPVSRGDFLRSAVQELRISAGTQTRGDLPYPRVPAALEAYVRIAHARGALAAYGNDLRLALPVTRGEALRVIAALLDRKPQSNRSLPYIDVQPEEAAAVRLAIEQQWMPPLRSSVYGARRVLTVQDMQALFGKIAPRAAPAERRTTPQTIRVNLTGVKVTIPQGQLLESIWQLLREEYLYTEKLDGGKAGYDAADALVKSLDDPYTSFMRPVDSKNFQTQLEGQVTGIGAQVEYVDGIVTIVAPLRSSPAEKAGLLPGDQIIAADGVALTNIGFGEAVEKIRGPRGSSVELTIRRSGQELRVNVKRDLVQIPEIEIRWNGSVAHVILSQFGKITQTDLRGHMTAVAEQRPDGIILDLRSNPGGLLDAANIVLSNFLPQGSTTAQIKSRAGVTNATTNQPMVVPENIPVVVLINEGSASASEIVAGALQDAKRATIVGTNTFGKGTVQQVVQFADQSGLKMTVAEWFTPNGRKIDGVGVAPDIFVEKGDRDEQFLRALELVRR